MFLRPFKVKSNSQVKGSDKKKFRSELKKSFPHLTDEDIHALIPSKEEMSVAKIFTHSEESILVYSLQKTPLFFELRRVLFPTVHALWRNPRLLPVIFVTFTNVVEKLQNGADLMIPGIILPEGDLNPRSYGRFEKGEHITICTEDNLAAVAVGQAFLSSFDMYMAARRGKGVQVHHVYGDLLWSFGGGKGRMPELGAPGKPTEESRDKKSPDGVGNSAEDSDGFTTVSGKSKVTKFKVSENGTEVLGSDEVQPAESDSVACCSNSLSNPSTSEDSAADDTTRLQEDSEDDDFESPSDILNNALDRLRNSEAVSDSEDSPPPSPEDAKESEASLSRAAMDSLILRCFLKAWRSTAKKAKLPILTSQFYALHVLPACPKSRALDVKTSSYKKFSRFLDEMEKEGVIRVEQLSKGVSSIVKVDLAHPLIRYFQDEEEEEEEVAATPEGADEEYSPPQVVEVHLVTANVMRIFQPCGYSKGNGLTMMEIRKCVMEYIKREGLQNKDDKNYVNMDPILTDCCLAKSEVHVKTKLKWEEVSSRCATRMTPAFKVTFHGKPPVMIRGKLEPIDLQVLTRTGNKKVTLIHNLEVYGIDHNDFARKCRLGVQASTTIATAPDKKGLHVLVQGNQINFVEKLLTEEYKLPKKYLRGLENAPKKKKK